MKRKSLAVLSLLVLLVGVLPIPAANAQGGTNPPIILTEGGTVRVTVYSLGGGCSGTAGLQSPGTTDLFVDYNNQQGVDAFIGPFPAGTELVFFLHPGEGTDPPYDWCAAVPGIHTDSTDPSRARITPGNQPNIWQIEWEDLPEGHNQRDDDFNDLVLIVSLIGAGTDLKQDDPQWANNPYDHVNGATIGGLGSALTSAAGVLSSRGGLNDSASSSIGAVAALNTCLQHSQVRGFYNGLVRWNKVGWCSDASGLTPPYLLEWEGRMSVGDARGSDLTEIMSTAATELDQSRLVIFEVRDPEEPSGTHYVIGTGEDAGAFEVSDPYCGGDPANPCPASRTQLSEFSEVIGLLLFSAGGTPNNVLYINAPAGVHFTVTDPNGLVTGSDGSNTFNEIPDSNYYTQEPPTVQPGSAPVTPATNELYIINPALGDYSVTVYGPSGSLRAEYAYGRLKTTARSVALTGGSPTEEHTLIVTENAIFWDEVANFLYLPVIQR